MIVLHMKRPYHREIQAMLHDEAYSVAISCLINADTMATAMREGRAGHVARVAAGNARRQPPVAARAARRRYVVVEMKLARSVRR